MFNKITQMLTALCFVLIVTVNHTSTVTQAQETDMIYHVSINGDDTNSGTSAAPLRTIQEAANRGVTNKRNNLNTKIQVSAGTYRESVALWMSAEVEQNSAKLRFEAEGNVIISGSDIWAEWQAIGNNRFTHSWDNNWGPYDSPVENIPKISRHRELVFVDGELLRQVLTLNELEPGNFIVDESSNLITIQPRDTSFEQVEIGLRDRLWSTTNINHLTLKGFTFQHAPSPWDNGKSAVSFDNSDNAFITNNLIQWNNGVGLFVGRSQAMTIQDTQMNNNGKDGISAWRMQNLHLLDSETNYNNWRGNWGDYASWWIGNKFVNTRDLHIENHTSHGNLSRGLWLDIDNQNALIDGATLTSNLRDGIFIEANQGPITVQNSLIENNGEHGVLGALSQQVTLHNLNIINNVAGGILFAQDSNYSAGRTITDFLTDSTTVVSLKDWTLNNLFIAQTDSPADFLVGTTLPNGDGIETWGDFTAGFQAEQNHYYHAEHVESFKLPGNSLINFCDWQSATDSDSSSMFGTEVLPCTLLEVPSTESSPGIDGQPDSVWAIGRWHVPAHHILESSPPESDLSAKFQAIHSTTHLYIFVDVTDDQIVTDSVDEEHPTDWWQDDAIELFIDGDNSAGDSFDQIDDFHLIFAADGAYFVGPKSTNDPNPEYAVLQTEEGYSLELKLSLESIGIDPVIGRRFGIDIHIDDDDNEGGRDHKLVWFSPIDDAWRNPSLFGTGTFTSGTVHHLFLPIAPNNQ